MLKQLLVILIITLSQYLNGQQIFEYSVKNNMNVDERLRNSSFIASYKTLCVYLCLVECTKNSSCLSCSFKTDTLAISDNCFLYNSQFTVNDYFYSSNILFSCKLNSSHVATNRMVSSTAASSGITITMPSPSTTTSMQTTSTTTTVSFLTSSQSMSFVSTTSTTTSIQTSTMPVLTSNPITDSITQTNVNFQDCNISLLTYFQNATLKSPLTTYNGNPFVTLSSTETAIINNTRYYFMTESSNGLIIQMDESWQFIKSFSFPKVLVLKWVNGFFYAGTQDGFYRTTENFTVTHSISDSSAYYTAIHVNKTDTTLFAAVWNRRRIDVFYANLTNMRSISTVSGYKPVGLFIYGDLLYVSIMKSAMGNNSTFIYAYRGSTQISTITIDNSTMKYIHSFLIDDNNYTALSIFDDKVVKLYHINGTYTGIMVPLTDTVYYLNVDFNCKILMNTQTALNFFN